LRELADAPRLVWCHGQVLGVECIEQIGKPAPADSTLKARSYSSSFASAIVDDTSRYARLDDTSMLRGAGAAG
jgi:hypothetical protein